MQQQIITTMKKQIMIIIIKSSEQSKNIKTLKEPANLRIWYANANTLTQDKIRELSMEINACKIPADIIAVTEIIPKHYKRTLQEEDYIIEGYTFEYENLTIQIQLEE